MKIRRNLQLHFHSMILYIYQIVCNKNKMLYIIFSAWLRTGSNPADINRFRSLTENYFVHLECLHLLENGYLSLSSINSFPRILKIWIIKKTKVWVLPYFHSRFSPISSPYGGGGSNHAGPIYEP